MAARHPGLRPRRAGGGPLRARARARWAVASAVAVAWLACMALTGSLVAGSALMLMIALLVVVAFVALRALGIGRGHPLVRSLATRPWRDGRDVLQVAIKHLPELFIITPKGAMLAPAAIELRMHPADLESLTEYMDLTLVHEFVADAYQAEIAARSARTPGGVPPQVSVLADGAVPPGRHALRQARQPGAAVDFPAVGVPAVGVPAVGVPAGAHAGAYGDDGEFAAAGALAAEDRTLRDPSVPTEEVTAGEVTAGEQGAGRNPLLRLVTGDSIAQTRVSGARAGRGRAAELLLPDDPAVSREHASFTCADGTWRVACLGRNGLVVNGTAVTGERALAHGDIIRWGMRADALISQVEIA